MSIYHSFDELRQSEVEGIDYIIVHRLGTSDTVILAPHGGRIEPGTTEIARALAGDDLSFYSFMGTKAAGNSTLHITSREFDEPLALQMVQEALKVLTVHGCAGEHEHTHLGGLDHELVKAIAAELRCAGFSADTREAPRLGGRHPSNLCNRGKTHAGVQLELSAGLRKRLLAERPGNGSTQNHASPLALFVSAVKRAIQKSCSDRMHSHDSAATSARPAGSVFRGVPGRHRS